MRPIEITDALAKAQEVGRMQQNAQMRPEVAQEYEKAMTDKLHARKAQAPDPVPETDQVVLHIDEKEQERRKNAEDEQNRRQQKKAGKKRGVADKAGHHIDLKA